MNVTIDLGPWESKGILITREEVCFVRLLSPVLIADGRAWARSRCEQLSDRLSAAIDPTDAFVHDLEEQIEDLEAWARDPVANRDRIEKASLDTPFSARQKLLPHLAAVRSSDQVPIYITALLANALDKHRVDGTIFITDEEKVSARTMLCRAELKARIANRVRESFVKSFADRSTLEWVFYVDQLNDCSVLYATEHLRAAIQHTGNCISGILAAGEEELYIHAADHLVRTAAGPDIPAWLFK